MRIYYKGKSHLFFYVKLCKDNKDNIIIFIIVNKGEIKMDTKEKFIVWMEKYSERSANTISKYLSAISTISRELTDYLGENINLYNLSESSQIDSIEQKYLSIQKLREKNERGNNMYTCSLKWYKKYLEDNTERGFWVKDYSKKYVQKYKKKPRGKFTQKDGLKYWYRDRAVVENVINLSESKCEYNDSHQYFISNKTGRNYVEGHHLIPMKYQEFFDYSIDTEANVISLCVVCHKILHFGKIEKKIDILNILYEKRKEKLKLSGIDINLDMLISLYK